MKKIGLLFILSIALSVTVFAEGDIPLGGKTGCPNGQTTCLTTTELPDNKSADPIYKQISDFLKSIFG